MNIPYSVLHCTRYRFNLPTRQCATPRSGPQPLCPTSGRVAAPAAAVPARRQRRRLAPGGLRPIVIGAVKAAHCVAARSAAATYVVRRGIVAAALATWSLQLEVANPLRQASPREKHVLMDCVRYNHRLSAKRAARACFFGCACDKLAACKTLASNQAQVEVRAGSRKKQARESCRRMGERRGRTGR